ncbi:hypothetical protein D9M68_462760 [compost metagenome]
MLVKQLSENYDVQTFSFSDSVKTGLDYSAQGKFSNAALLVDQLKDQFLNRNLGAVIIASDGIFNRGGNPVYDLKSLNAPVYTIALGDTIPRKDILIADVSYNDLVYLDNEFTLDIQMEAYQAQGEHTRITVSENGVKVKEENLHIDNNRFVKNVQVRLKADKIGVQQYRVEIQGLENEISTENNVQTIFIEVIDSRKKVMLLADAPHPDIATLKQAIELNKHYEVTIALPDNQNQLNLADYSLAILYQFPGIYNDSSALIRKLKESGLPMWYILGTQTQINLFNNLQSILKLNRTNGMQQEVFPSSASGFTLFNIESTMMKSLDEFDPLLTPFGNLVINGNYEAVLHQRIGKVNTQSPLWFFSTHNGIKAGFLLGEGLWRWKLEEAKNPEKASLVNELIAKSLQYLSVKDDKRKFKVYSQKTTFEESESVVLNATLYNDAYEPVNTPDVNVQVKDKNGKTYTYAFSRNDKGYRLDMGPMTEGTYTYTASTVLGENKYRADGSFYVQAVNTEYQQTTANHQLLQAIAQQHGGKLYLPDQLMAIANELKANEQIKTIRYEDRHYEELINFKWLFAMILVWLSTEWFLRKRNGEV